MVAESYQAGTGLRYLGWFYQESLQLTKVSWCPKTHSHLLVLAKVLTQKRMRELAQELNLEPL